MVKKSWEEKLKEVLIQLMEMEMLLIPIKKKKYMIDSVMII